MYCARLKRLIHFFFFVVIQFLLLLVSIVKGADILKVDKTRTFKTLKCCFWDTAKFDTSSNRIRQELMVKTLKKIDSDVVVLAGIKDEKAFAELKNKLSGYSFTRIIEASDPASHLVFLAKTAPFQFKELTRLTYKIKNKKGDFCRLPVKRGFFHVIYNLPDYRLHILGAHLCERRKNPQFNQTDMRRYEARQLRYQVTAILIGEPEANILVMGNFNDDCGKATVKDIYNRHFGIKKRLFDLRPLDRLRTSWTYWNPDNDEYERIDYLLCSSPLIPEIKRSETYLWQQNNWLSVFRHRPLITRVELKNRPIWHKTQLDKDYPHSIYAPKGAKHFDEREKIGNVRKRLSPKKDKKKKKLLSPVKQ